MPRSIDLSGQMRGAFGRTPRVEFSKTLGDTECRAYSLGAKDQRRCDADYLRGVAAHIQLLNINPQEMLPAARVQETVVQVLRELARKITEAG